MKVILASSNKGKLREIQAILKPLNIELIPQSDFAITDADETGLTFIENALIKARQASKISGLPALADDSGLSVDALDGAPGIYSSRYSGVNASDEQNNKKLLSDLARLPASTRKARFHCILVFMRHEYDPCPIISQGVWDGEILEKPRGINGFGYDPLFYSPEHQAASAELSAETKNRSSHRAKALTSLIPLLDDATKL